MPPATRYAKSGDVHIAYQVSGAGRLDPVYVPGFVSHLEHAWAGVHTGEVELGVEQPGGITLHVGARIAALAGSGEVLASHTAKDLVAGSGLGFDDRGLHALRGVPGEWRLFAVQREHGT